MTIDENDINVSVKLTEKATTFVKATATLTLPYVKIKGFRIMESKYDNEFGDYVWVDVPVNKTSRGGFIKLVWFSDKELWGRIEHLMLGEYHVLIEKDATKRRLAAGEDGGEPIRLAV